MNAVRAILFSTGLAMGLQPIAVRADAGHDHGTPHASGLASPAVARVEAQSDLFEIVGVVESGTMTLFVDRFATNDPVTGATIDLEVGPVKGSAQANPDGTYSFKHAALAEPGQYPVTFTINAGSDSDLLAGELVLADPVAAKAGASADLLRKPGWWGVGALLLGAGLAIAWRSRRGRGKGGSQ
jgi:hypothetical protein